MSVVAVSGASGRLGSFVCKVIEEHSAFTLGARLGRDSGLDEGSEAAILFDVSHPDTSFGTVERALRRGQRVVVGTSGWSADRLARLEEIVAEMPGSAVVVVPNFSLGSVLGTVMAQIAAPYFESIEIVETHHEAKVDSPSGTAVRTAELISAAREGEAIDAPFHEQRARGELIAGVPVHSLRLRGVVARQEVHFGGAGEVLTISHDTQSQNAYRAGIQAALEAIGEVDGLVVGLDRVLGIDLGIRAS